MALNVTINSTDRSSCFSSIRISDEVKDAPSYLNCTFEDQDNVGDIGLDDEIVVTLDSTKIFAGYVIRSKPSAIGSNKGIVSYRVQCVDYTRILDRRLVVESYENMTDLEIIQDIVANYCQGSGITTTEVEEGVTFEKLVFNYQQPSQCFRKICQLTGRSWYLDYDKVVHYFPLETDTSPFNITDASANYGQFDLEKDNTNIKNKVYVRGGTYLSDETTIEMVADGEQYIFELPDKVHDFSMEEGGVSKTVGIKNIDLTGFDYVLNYQEKYVERLDETAPADGTVMSFTYKYEIPILVAIEDTDSINDIGVYEFAIFDPDIKTVADAQARASAELTDYADTIIDGSFKTWTNGFRAGQYINIDLTDYGIDENYLIQKVVANAIADDKFEYTVYIGSAKKVGMVQFLLRLLEQDKNFLDLSDDEVVDALWTPDSDGIVIEDSLADSTIDSPPFQWGSFKWGFAEWN